MIYPNQKCFNEINKRIPDEFKNEVYLYIDILQSMTTLFEISIEHEEHEEMCIFLIKPFEYCIHYIETFFTFDSVTNTFRFVVADCTKENDYNEIKIINPTKGEVNNAAIQTLRKYYSILINKEVTRMNNRKYIKNHTLPNKHINTILKLMTRNTKYRGIFEEIENIVISNNFNLLANTENVEKTGKVSFVTSDLNNENKSDYFYLSFDIEDTFFTPINRKNNIKIESVDISIIKNKKVIKKVSYKLEEIRKEQMNEIEVLIQQFVMRYQLEGDK